MQSQARFGLIVGWMHGTAQLVRTLRGLTQKFGCFDDEAFDESRIEKYRSPATWPGAARVLVLDPKLQARYPGRRLCGGIEAASKAQPMLWASVSLFEMAEYHFYGALCLCGSLGCRDGRPATHTSGGLVQSHREKSKFGQRNCPENYENCLLSSDAEIARIESRELEQKTCTNAP